MFKWGIVLFLSIVLLGVSGCPRWEATSDGDHTLTFTSSNGSERTLRVAGAFPDQVTTVEIDDPNYHRRKRFQAVPLAPVLLKGFGLSASELAERRLVFRAEDGYAVHSDGAIALELGGYVAFRDLDVPAWEPVGPHQVSPRPFYIVWTGEEQQDQKIYPWPYGLTHVESVDLREAYGLTFPNRAADPLAHRGHSMFLRDCIRCHAINRQGGRLGPELNVPKNILEYRDEAQVRAFIRNPASFRYSNMPAMPHLGDKDLDALVAYLAVMATHKSD